MPVRAVTRLAGIRWPVREQQQEVLQVWPANMPHLADGLEPQVWLLQQAI
jgi:hypothetical protein